MKQTNKTMGVTWGMAIKIWWWIFWRSLLFAVGGGFVLGFIFGFIGAMAGLDIATIQPSARLLGGILGIIINIFFTKKIIGKKFKNFSLVLLKNEQSK